MLRFRFSMADLGRVVVSDAPAIEVAASLDALGDAPRSVFMERWRTHALPRIPPSARRVVSVLRALPRTPPEILTDGCALPTEGPLWTALHAYRDACLGDVWQRVQAEKTRAVATVTGALIAHGVLAALGSLGPSVRWRGDHLEADHPKDADIDLAGRGLRLVPSVFWQTPQYTEHGIDRPTLTFPVGAAPGRADTVADPLVTLLGRTRADVLRATVTGAGTGEIARRIGVSAASVSEHATALRQAGLLHTARTGREVRHSPTPLGRRLITPGSIAPVSALAEKLATEAAGTA
ncbi:helix-turn-helix domain-containing protein [Phytomonospora sp. NPDC050363]|uniref:ArsR/SmtB family transcription factor n=1 Tax=Phytomonospora sp. NPDC050363 TaxID=3155642 RepID=UPI0033CA7515